MHVHQTHSKAQATCLHMPTQHMHTHTHTHMAHTHKYRATTHAHVHDTQTIMQGSHQHGQACTFHVPGLAPLLAGDPALDHAFMVTVRKALASPSTIENTATHFKAIC
jgi:hypothetical protein